MVVKREGAEVNTWDYSTVVVRMRGTGCDNGCEEEGVNES